MSLKKQFYRARKAIDLMTPSEKRWLTDICARVRRSEEALIAAAEAAPVMCYRGCEGLCCKNIHPDEIIGLTDAVFILASIGKMPGPIRRAIQREPLFSGPCVFLENGVGPCIFPFNVRPRLCITTFCREEDQLPEIKTVRKAYSRLSRFLAFHLLRRIRRSFLGKSRPAGP